MLGNESSLLLDLTQLAYYVTAVDKFLVTTAYPSKFKFLQPYPFNQKE